MVVKGRIVQIGRTFVFLSPLDEPGRDYFAHRADMIDVRPEMLKSGDILEFEPLPDAPRGPRATQVRRA